MTEILPNFTYHPDPLATGAVEAKATVCACCGEARGFVYAGPVYGDADLDNALCPWCIADGSAASKLGASFADSFPLEKAGIADAIVQEVHLRTPGYVSWQQEYWLSHCKDACEFHGDATEEEVAAASLETRAHWLSEYEQDEEGWQLATEGYKPGGCSAFYKFVCRHCRLVMFGWDLC